jgi:hypothetical protein
MIAAISNTDRNLPWPHITEGEAFHLPCTYQ